MSGGLCSGKKINYMTIVKNFSSKPKQANLSLLSIAK